MLSYQKYAKEWNEAMQEAYKKAKRSIDKNSAKGKARHDRGFGSAVLKAGDRVLVRNLSERGGPGKLRSYWEDRIHTVVRRMSDDSPVYQVKPEGKPGKLRTLHRNLLLPCDSLPLEIDKESHRGQKSRTRKVKHQSAYKATHSSSSSGEEGNLIPRLKPYEVKPVPSEVSTEATEGIFNSSLNPNAEPFNPDNSVDEQVGHRAQSGSGEIADTMSSLLTRVLWLMR